MSYLVMARKWRPKNFEEMVGQEHIAQTLRNAIASGRVSHAYLFTGTRGVGKTTSARILAKALNCQNGPTATPCEVCDNCLAVNRGASMDVLEIDGASNNSVDNIRDLREQVAYAPMQGQYKIYIIDEVHMLSKAAFNALLKTLEEPPPHVVFIFATTESGKVPHTILSRVQRFDFKRIAESAIADRLAYICEQEGIVPEREALEVLARKADGSMRDALSLFDRVYAFAGESLTLEAARKALGIPAESLFDDLLQKLSTHDTGGCLTVVNAVYEDGLEISEFLTGFGEYLRDLLFVRQPGVTPALLGLGETRFAAIKQMAGDLQDGDILRYAKIVSDLLAGLKTAPHPRLWVELGLARMAALDRVVTLSQLMGVETPPSGIPHPAPAAPAAREAGDPKKKSPELTAATHAAPAAAAMPPEVGADAPPPWEPEPPSYPDDAGFPAPAPQDAGDDEAAPSPVDASRNAFPETSGSADDADAPEATADEDVPRFAVTAPGDDDEASEPPARFNPAEAPARWPDLVEDYALDRPFTSSPLRHSRLIRKEDKDEAAGGSEGAITLEVLFSNEHHHDLFLADGENRKSLRAFLATRFDTDAFALVYAHEGMGASASEEPGGKTVTHAIHAAGSVEAAIRAEPVIGTLIEMFEGRVLN